MYVNADAFGIFAFMKTFLKSFYPRLCGKARFVPVRDGGIAGVARAGDVVFIDEVHDCCWAAGGLQR
jgi:hypothetical protein